MWSHVAVLEVISAPPIVATIFIVCARKDSTAGEGMGLFGVRLNIAESDDLLSLKGPVMIPNRSTRIDVDEVTACSSKSSASSIPYCLIVHVDAL